MSLREQLLDEVSRMSSASTVELDGIFEAVEIAPELKENFKTAFNNAVKANSAALAESYIDEIVEKSEQYVEQAIAESSEELHEAIVAQVDRFMNVAVDEWMVENEIAIESELKSSMFESMFNGLKNLFIEHNVSLPSEKVDVVAEMSNELQEMEEHTRYLTQRLNESEDKVEELVRDKTISEGVQHLTESQRERVYEIMEGSSLDNLESVISMVESVTKYKQSRSAAAIDENFDYTTPSDATSKNSDEVDVYVRAATMGL